MKSAIADMMQFSARTVDWGGGAECVMQAVDEGDARRCRSVGLMGDTQSGGKDCWTELVRDAR